jgi:hypothetical protein
MNAIHELPSTHLEDDLIKLIDTVAFLHHQVLRQKLASLYHLIQRIAARGIKRIVFVRDAVHMVRAAGGLRRQGLEMVPEACHHQLASYTFAV